MNIIKNPKKVEVLPPKSEKNIVIPQKVLDSYSEEEALKWIFSHSNKAGAIIMNVTYHRFTSIRFNYNTGKLGHSLRSLLLQQFGFTAKYYLNK